MEKKLYKSKLKICYDCKGEGKFWIQDFSPRHGSDLGSGSWIKCTVCEGACIVRETKNITITFEPYYPEP